MSTAEFTNANRVCDYSPKHSGLTKGLEDQPMIDSIEIENIRGFDKLKVKSLKQFNLIVGQNAGGKTAFLESIYIGSGQPGLSLKLDVWRGISEQVVGLNPATLDVLWANLLHGNSKIASVSLVGSDDISRKLEISLGKPETLLVSADNELKDVEQVAPISFQWFKDGRAITEKIRPQIELNTLTGC
jgi:hypothetical protein